MSLHKRKMNRLHPRSVILLLANIWITIFNLTGGFHCPQNLVTRIIKACCTLVCTQQMLTGPFYTMKHTTTGKYTHTCEHTIKLMFIQRFAKTFIIKLYMEWNLVDLDFKLIQILFGLSMI